MASVPDLFIHHPTFRTALVTLLARKNPYRNQNMIPKPHIDNFETLKCAAADGNLALMECTDATTGEPRYVICAVSQVQGQYLMTPFGHMCPGNPYEEYLPPQGIAA